MPVILFLFQNISPTIYRRSLEPQHVLTDVYFHLGPSEGWGLETNFHTMPTINQIFYQAQEIHGLNPHHLGNLSLVGKQTYSKAECYK